MAFSWRTFLSLLNDVGRVYEGRERYVRLFKTLRKVEQLYRHDSSESQSQAHTDAAKVLASVCSQNGAMWIKCTQYLSCRPDLLPSEYIDVFSALQTQSENTHAQGFSLVRETLSSAWGEEWEQYFSDFNLIPLASGSIAQVYKATLKAVGEVTMGTTVAVKVRTPGVEELYAQDIIVLRALAKCFDPLLREFPVVSIVEEIIESTLPELDFNREKSNILEYATLKRKHPIHCPNVIEFLCSERILVTKWIDGQPLQGILKERENERCDAMVEQVALAIIEDIFQHGIYHGDPHPGNVMVSESAQPHLIDFGLLGRLTDVQRGQYFVLMLAFMGVGPKPNFSDLFQKAGFQAQDPKIFEDIGQFVEGLHKDETLDSRARIQAIFNSLRRNKVDLPSGFVGILRVVILLTGIFQSRSLEFSTVFARH